jgi:hypothetical protein
MRIGRFVTVAVLTAGLVVLASHGGSISAQQKGKGKGFGFGGFGFGGPGSLNVAVLSNKALQEELKVTAEQKEKLKPTADKQTAMQKKMQDALKDAAGDFEKMREIGTKMQDDFKTLGEETKKVVETTLTADQTKRLRQIEVQQSGPRAFATEETVKGLNLTDAQKTKIKGIADEFQKDSGEARREMFQSGGDQEKIAEVQRKIDKLQKAAMTDIEGVLTDEQKKTWKTIVGEPFDLSKLRQPFRKID